MLNLFRKLCVSVFFAVAFPPAVWAGETQLEEYHFWQEARYQWGQFAGPANVQLFHEDVTCSGQPDYVGGFLSDIDPDRDAFGIIVATWGDGEPETAFIELPVDEDTQYSLAGGEYANNPPVLSIEHYEPEVLADMVGALEACHMAMVVDDGMTDGIRIFWLKDSQDGDPRFTIFRN